jgi:HAD superfamily hydrolase (TIGR01509 family)
LPGVLSLLGEVRTAGLPHALVTSSEPAVVDAVLGRLDVRFEVVVCAADVVHAKPDPEGYRLAAAKLGADPRRCIALEDSANGVAAAEAAGCRVIAVPSIAPVPERPGRAVLPTLAGVTLARLQELAGLTA